MMHAMGKTVAAGQSEGGYYAIKGFLYQFDKTLIEVLTHPRATVAFENQQDINYEDFVLQVKHRETQDYAHSKVRKAVESLMSFFSIDSSKRICLYCHFRDKVPGDWDLTLEELDSVISDSAKTRYPASFRKQFLGSFIVRFSEDYETQFKQTLGLIKSSFNVSGDEMAALYHSIFRSKLLDRSVGARSARNIRFTDLQSFLDDAEIRLFEGAYTKHIGAAKYAQIIKRAFFTFRLPNIENFERLFVIECDSKVTATELIRFAALVSRKFYKQGKSPQPYIAFRKLTDGRLKKVKQGLFDSKIHFFDGTHFDGDRFRLDDLTKGPSDGRAFTLKLVAEHQVRSLVRNAVIREAFQFFVSDPLQLSNCASHRRIQIKRTEDVLRMII